MAMEQLFTLPPKYDSVLSNNSKEIAQIISATGYQFNKFYVNPRHAKWNADAVVECNCEWSGEYLTKLFELFTTDKTLFYFSIYDLMSKSLDLIVLMMIQTPKRFRFASDPATSTPFTLNLSLTGSIPKN